MYLHQAPPVLPAALFLLKEAIVADICQESISTQPVHHITCHTGKIIHNQPAPHAGKLADDLTKPMKNGLPRS